MGRPLSVAPYPGDQDLPFASLPPFADALRLLDKVRRVKLLTDAEALEKCEDDDEEEGEGSGRDIFGEMEIAARVMITSGDVRGRVSPVRTDCSSETPSCSPPNLWPSEVATGFTVPDRELDDDD